MPPHITSPATSTATGAHLQTTSAVTPPVPTVTAGPPEPQIELREEAPASNVYVTLSITRDYTTYTTTILLAGTTGPALPSTDITLNPTTSGFLVPPTTSTIPLPPSQSTFPTATSTDPNQSVLIGAIVGSILGSFFFLFLFWLCFFRRPFRVEGSVTTSASSSTSGSVPSPAPRPRAGRVRYVREVHTRSGGFFGGWSGRRDRLDDD